MTTTANQPSQALIEANKRLLELRSKQAAPRQIEPVAADPPWLSVGDNDPELLTLARLAGAGIGFGSGVITAALLAMEDRERVEDDPECWPISAPVPTLAKVPTLATVPTAADYIVVYPTLALAILDHKFSSAGRLWLLFRYLDHRGQGWINLPEARRLLCEDGDLKLCNRRRLRQVLNDGNGLFWLWDKRADRVWLRSVVKVADALNVDWLAGKVVRIKVSDLLAGMGEARAALYASFHISRQPEKGTARPISRATLGQLTGTSTSTLIRYEKRQGIEVKYNYVIGNRADPFEIETSAYREGSRYFILNDGNGKHGNKGIKYSAWQLPNSFGTNKRHHGRGRQRAINKELIDLCNNRGVRNDQNFNALYHLTGNDAVKAASGDSITYWKGGTTNRSGAGLWYFFM